MLQFLTGIPPRRPILEPQSRLGAPLVIECPTDLATERTARRQATRRTILISLVRPVVSLNQNSNVTAPLCRPSAVLFYTPDTVVDLCAYFDAVSYRPGLAFPGSSLLGRAAGDTGLYHRASQPAKSYQQRQIRNSWADLPVSWSLCTKTGPRSALVGPCTIPTGYLICLVSPR